LAQWRSQFGTPPPLTAALLAPLPQPAKAPTTWGVNRGAAPRNLVKTEQLIGRARLVDQILAGLEAARDPTDLLNPRVMDCPPKSPPASAALDAFFAGLKAPLDDG
jgi:hypothetical protein